MLNEDTIERRRKCSATSCMFYPAGRQAQRHKDAKYLDALAVLSALKMLIISIVIGAPLSYFVNTMWLQKLPNRVEFGFGTVLLGTVILLVLGLITIGSQTLTASRRNPVDALKVE